MNDDRIVALPPINRGQLRTIALALKLAAVRRGFLLQLAHQRGEGPPIEADELADLERDLRRVYQETGL